MTDLILLSGGLDSATLLGRQADLGLAGLALSVDYGQRHVRELDAAATIAAYFNVEHVVIDMRSWGRLVFSSAVIVPNRNATLLMSAAGVALARGCQRVLTAVHAGDHAIFPDCRPAFLGAAHRAVQLATDRKVSVLAPFVLMSKARIAQLAGELGVPVADTWSCYEAGELHCGRCGACVPRIDAMRAAGMADPTAYQVDIQCGT